MMKTFSLLSEEQLHDVSGGHRRRHGGGSSSGGSSGGSNGSNLTSLFGNVRFAALLSLLGVGAGKVINFNVNINNISLTNNKIGGDVILNIAQSH